MFHLWKVQGTFFSTIKNKFESFIADMDTWEARVKGSVENMKYTPFLGSSNSYRANTQITSSRAANYHNRLTNLHVSIQELKKRVADTDDQIDNIQKDIDTTRNHHRGVHQENTETHQQITDSLNSKESVTNWLNVLLALQVLVTMAVVAIKIRSEKDMEFSLGV